jgi:hypothetical protein
VLALRDAVKKTEKHTQTQAMIAFIFNILI